MEFLSQMGRIIVGAMDSALVYNRKKALHKRLKHMIQRENRQVNRKYLLLGKYCYKNLQNSISDESVKKNMPIHPNFPGADDKSPKTSGGASKQKLGTGSNSF